MNELYRARLRVSLTTLIMIKYIQDVNVLNTCQFNKLGSKNLIQPNVDENSILMENSMKKMGVFLIMTVEN
jgi:hypothetical protein